MTGESRGLVVRGGTPEDAFFRLSLATLAPALIGQGSIDEGIRDRALARSGDPGTTMLTPVVVAAGGRVPL